MTISVPKNVLIGVICFLAGVGVTAIAFTASEDGSEAEPAASSDQSDAQPAANSDEVPSTSATSTTEGELEARQASCDTGSGNDLIGSVRLTNGADNSRSATVTFTWLLGDGGSIPADAPQTIELEPGQRELVFFEKRVRTNEYLSFQDHPDYFSSKNCEFEVTE